MSSTTATDPRLDPRIEYMMRTMPTVAQADVASREELLEQAASEEAVAVGAATTAWMDACDSEEIFAICCPAISRETAASIAQFCREA